MMRLALVLAGTFLLVSAHLLYGLTIEMSESVDSLIRLSMVIHAVAAFYAAAVIQLTIWDEKND
tara:strand:+ start:586 stop:777 length:192 start_codon:yes stop_codon:yes gene_type:complete